MSALSRRAWIAAWLILCFVLLFGWRVSSADTMPTLFNSFAGNINFIGTQKTLRTQADGGNSCAINTGTTTATLAGLPAGATIRAAYLYWAASGDTPDYNVTFEGDAVAAAATRRYTSTFNNGGTDFNYFSGVVDVTATVAAKGNGSYSFAGLTVDNGNPWCGSSAVMGGWALLVMYSHASEDFRVINVYEGFQYFRGSSITLTPSNFQIPVSPINGKNAHLTWEGDVGNSAALGGFTEQLTFNGNVLSDASNPVNNQFNSVSSINSDAASYGVDFDAFNISAYLAAGQTSATTVYSSGGDLVLLSAQVISTTNEPVADLEISMTRNGALTPGQNASYTLSVINNGPLIEPGPIRIVDTLPAGLSYGSAAGSGWSCSAALQVVTCDLTASLASGVSAPALTLTVAVSGGASGLISNSATVSGQAFDNISWNDTATDSYYLLPAAYAYYAMDETSWGTVTDSSGNGRDGSVLGSAAPTGYPPAIPPDSAIAGNPGTCGAGSVPVTAGSQGVNASMVDPNNIGNAGTIAFWYNGNAAWSDGTDRMLFDASNELGNNANDKHFYLVKGDSGRLRFAFENSGDTDYEARDPTGRNFAAGTWHHIAVTWNVGADVARLYLDGVQVATSAATSGTLGNTATLYLGDQRNAVGGTPGDFTTNSANGYIDEVRIYSSALSAADVAGVMALTHSCGAPLHHVRIEHGSGTSLTCNTSTLTLRACADAGCTAYYTGGVTGSLTAAGTPTVNWVGGTGFTIASGASTVTKDVQVTTPGSAVFGTSGVNPVPGTSTSCNFGTPGCTFTAADSGFIFDVPNHTADTMQNVTLAAVRTDDVTQKCVPAFQGVSRTVNFWSSYLNPNSGTLALNLNGGNVASAGPGTGVSLNFDANGETTLQVRYPDVGQMRLNASYAGSGTGAGLVMTGQDNFVTRPARFVLTIPGNPAAANASGGVFKRAGENFTVNVEAQNASNAITPNYGLESVAETVLLTKALAAPAGGNNPALVGSFGAFGLDCSGGPATAGTACGTFSWPEVGIITLTPSVGDADYLGAGDVSGTASGNVGRFIPYHFDVTKIHGCTGGAAFTYSGQPFAMVTVTACAAAGTPCPIASITRNYHGPFGFSKDTTISDAGSTANFANNAIAAASFTNGIGNQTTVTYAFPAKETVPLTLTLRAVDTPDNVSSAGYTEETAEIRSGRVRIQNAYGSELAALAVPMRAEYYVDTTITAPATNPSVIGWITNTADTCSSTVLSALSNFQGNLNSGETCVLDTGSPGVSGQGCAAAALLADRYSSPPSAGSYNLNLQAPGAGNDGSVDISTNLSTKPWLRFDWNGTGDTDPTGRATFGLYRGSPRHIYLRQRF